MIIVKILNRVCEMLSEAFTLFPVSTQPFIGEFNRPCFYVRKATIDDVVDLNKFVFRETKTYQIIFHGELNAQNELDIVSTMEVSERINRLFNVGYIKLLEEKRAAKIIKYSSELKETEKVLYISVQVTFTDEKPADAEDIEPAKEIKLSIK